MSLTHFYSRCLETSSKDPIVFLGGLSQFHGTVHIVQRCHVVTVCLPFWSPLWQSWHSFIPTYFITCCQLPLFLNFPEIWFKGIFASTTSVPEFQTHSHTAWWWRKKGLLATLNCWWVYDPFWPPTMSVSERRCGELEERANTFGMSLPRSFGTWILSINFLGLHDLLDHGLDLLILSWTQVLTLAVLIECERSFMANLDPRTCSLLSGSGLPSVGCFVLQFLLTLSQKCFLRRNSF